MTGTAVWLWVVIGLVVGLLLLGISSAIMRSLREEQARAPSAPAWTQLVDESLVGLDAQTRLDIVERLSIVNTAWSRDVLENAKNQERDANVRAAIHSALGR